MKESLELAIVLNAKPSEVYEAWLNSEQHTAMTGGEASCSNKVGDNFTAWDGYIEGKNLSLIPSEEITQSWRTSEFDENDENSILIVRLKELGNGTELTLVHSNIPEGQTQYEQGWQDHYFTPMVNFFNGRS